ncbi:MAG: radical SAM protein [bacterium]|nr:radical SAM protein [bacterium]
MQRTKLPYIIYEVTSVCNLRCRYCYNPWKRPGETDQKDNSYKLAKKALKQLFKVAEIDHVTMTGGEPFLAERFSEIVLFCRMEKKGVTIISNGATASDEDYRIMLELGVDLFEFPFHSVTPEIHDHLTQVPGSQKKVLNSFKYVIEHKGYVVPAIVITGLNYKNVGERLRFLNKEFGINTMMLNRFNIGGTGIKEIENIKITNEQLNEAFKDAAAVGKELNLTLTSNVCTPFCVLNPKDYPNIRMSSCSSSVTNMPLTLDINGNMRLCNHSPVVVGNIYKDQLKNMLRSEYVKEWKTTVPEFCKGCKVFPECLGGCRAASEQVGNSILKEDPVTDNWIDSTRKKKFC